MLRSQELIQLLTRKDRFVTDWAVAVLREAGPEQHPLESELVEVVKGTALPLPLTSLLPLLQEERNPQTLREKVMANLVERDRIVMRLFNACPRASARDRLLGPLNRLIAEGSADEACFGNVIRLLLGHRESRERILAGFESLPRLLRWSSIVSLDGTGDLQYLSLFISALEDPEPAVVQVALKAIGHLGAHAAIDEIIARLVHPREEVVIAAVRTLGEFRDARATLPLMKLMAGTRSHRVRATVIAALGNFSETRTIPVLSRYLSHADERVRANAITAIARKLLATGSKDAEMLTRLRESLGDPNHRVRADAISSLWQLGEIDSLDEIEKMIDSSDEIERSAGAYLIGRLKLLQFKDRLAAMTGDESWRVRKLSALSLLALGDAGKPVLRHLLAQGAEKQRLVAAFALSLAGFPDAQGLLLWASRQGGSDGELATELLSQLAGNAPRLATSLTDLDPNEV